MTAQDGPGEAVAGAGARQGGRGASAKSLPSGVVRRRVKSASNGSVSAAARKVREMSACGYLTLAAAGTPRTLFEGEYFLHLSQIPGFQTRAIIVSGGLTQHTQVASRVLVPLACLEYAYVPACG